MSRSLGPLVAGPHRLTETKFFLGSEKGREKWAVAAAATASMRCGITRSSKKQTAVRANASYATLHITQVARLKLILEGASHVTLADVA